ncbi:MAG: hypothetical protein M1813_000840 [Trichoglossum hirsutum]|nr:MAG: hypothetical protein M1813_000840 [Trichoglossum hirsutum]
MSSAEIEIEITTDGGDKSVASATQSDCARGDYDKCLRDLFLTNPSEDLAAIRRCGGGRVDGTCEWILERGEYKMWLAGDGSQILRITGAPGIGKTMTSSFLVEELERKAQETPAMVLVYYFCDGRDERRNTATAILRGLVLQLLTKEPGYFELIREDYDLQGEYLFCDPDGLWEIFLRVLKSLAREVYVLVDALDECDRTSSQDLLTLLTQSLHSQQPDGHINAKFLITCRPEPDILKFDVAGDLPLDLADISADLRKYIRVRVDDISREKDYSPALAQDIRDTLLGNAGGTFVWVALVIGVLKKLTLPSLVEEKLQRLPLDLSGAYDMALCQVHADCEKIVEIVLCLVVAARRPLKTEELAMASALVPGGRGDNIIPPTNSLYRLSDRFGCCEPLIYIDAETETVNIFHQSTKDYLLSDHLQSIGIGSLSRYHVVLERANFTLFQVCWEYLSMDEFKHGSMIIRRGSNDELSPQPLSNKFLDGHRFLQYAAEEWRTHALAAIPALVNNSLWVSDNLSKLPTLRDTLLLEVAARGHEAAVRLLIENGANVEAKEGDLRTTLHRAVYVGSETIVNLLLEYGADIGARDRWGSTPLFRAADGDREAIAKLLLERGVDIEEKNNNGRTALFGAVGRCGKTAVAKLLLEKGANPNAKDLSGMPVLVWVAQHGLVSAIKLLLENGADIEATDFWRDTAINEAARCGREAAVESLLTEGVDINIKGYDGRTALIGGAINGHEGVVRVLLENGADVNEVDSDDVTALQWAAEGGHQSVVRLILEKGSDVNAKDVIGRTALLRAASGGHKVVARQLCEQGANLAGTDDNGQTALHQAAWCGHDGVVMLLLEEGADIQARSNDGWTALIGAASRGHESVVRVLLENGADVGTKANTGQTALHMASMQDGYELVVRMLLGNGADTKAKDKEDRTALHEAVRGGHKVIAKALLEGGANINAKDCDGGTPLIGEVVNGHEAMVRLLLEHGVDVEVKDKIERTALIWGAVKGFEGIVKLLLEKGADVNAVDEYGDTATDWASRQGHWTVILRAMPTQGAQQSSPSNPSSPEDVDWTGLDWERDGLD